MSASRDNPPRCIAAIFRRLFQGTRGGEALEDLDREYANVSGRHSRVVAWGWYVVQLLRPDTWLLPRALRRMRKADASSTRAAASRGDAGIPWLDLKLGLRMLVRYPGLTVLGGLAMAFAVLVAACTFEFLAQVAYPDLPFPDGERAVWLRLWDTASSREEARALHDFGVWQDELESVEDLGAYRTVERNLITADGAVALVTTAEITASAFRVAAIPPELGRALIDEDERAGAPPVIVLSHGVWRSQFASDPEVVGSVVRLDADPFTIVGVMPEGFGFPLAHQAWVPFQLNALGTNAWQPRQGPTIRVFGRLAPHISLGEARTELEGVGARLTAILAETHEHIRPQIAPFALSALSSALSILGSFTDLVSTLAFSANLPVALFVILVCGNVALLLFARAATRQGEMVVRSALGASRRRLITQLFAEALVLAVLASAVGLAVAGWCMRWTYRLLETEFGRLPFWFHPSLSLQTVLYALGLALLGGGLAGVVPGLKVTRGLGARLRQAGAGGGGFRFGGVWTAVIVCQIAVTVGFPLLTLAIWFDGKGSNERLKPIAGFAAEEYLSARLRMDWVLSPGRRSEDSQDDQLARFASTLRQLEDRLLADPRVAGVTFTQRLPRQWHPWRQIEVAEGAPTPRDERGYRLADTFVDIDYFDVLGAEILAGRNFHSGDLNAAPAPVIVNESFVERILGGGNAVGKHIRYVATEEARGRPGEPSEWLEIVGVVSDLGTTSIYGPQGVYHPAPLGVVNPIHVAIHVAGNAQAFGPELRRLAASADPVLRVDHVMAVDEVTDALRSVNRFWTSTTTTACAVALLLSLGGIYAVMSFTVSQRTREIGIRVALGSSRWAIVLATLRRPLSQLTLGIVAGGVLVTVVGLSSGVRPTPGLILQGVAYLAGITLVCLTACVVPVRRALSVEPSEALRVE